MVFSFYLVTTSNTLATETQRISICISPSVLVIINHPYPILMTPQQKIDVLIFVLNLLLALLDFHNLNVNLNFNILFKSLPFPFHIYLPHLPLSIHLSLSKNKPYKSMVN